MIPACRSFLESIGSVFEEVEGFRALVGFCHLDSVSYKQGVPDPHGNALWAARIGRRLNPAFLLTVSGWLPGARRWWRRAWLTRADVARIGRGASGVAWDGHLQVSGVGRFRRELRNGPAAGHRPRDSTISRPPRPSPPVSAAVTCLP